MPYHYETGRLTSQEVEIAITHCGICHSDLHLISNDWGISQYPFIPGHEIIGTVAAVGSEAATADDLRAAKRMGVSDERLASEWKLDGADQVRGLRAKLGVKPVFKLVDTCAAEFESYTPYLYSCYDEED